MKAMVQERYGSAEVLEPRDIDKPEIGDSEVLIRVRAAGVNIADMDVGRALAIEGPGEWRGGVFRQTAPGVWKVRNRGTSTVRVLTVAPRGPR